MKGQLNSNNLIAVSGVKGSGKGLCSEMLQYCLSVPKIFRQYWIFKNFRKLFPKKYKMIAFADPLKAMLATLLNIPVERFNDRQFKESWCLNIPTLNLLDDPYAKLSDSKFNKWIKDLSPELTKSTLTIRQLMQYFGTEGMMRIFGKNVWINSTLRHGSKRTIITDLRFKAEAKAVHDLGGIIIYVSRPGYTFGQHASEKEMSELLSNGQYEYVIDNDGTQKDLFNEIKQISNGI